MSFTLVIVESPAKCKKIENYLGNNYKCIASYGHFCQLDGLKSINIEDNLTKKNLSDNTKEETEIDQASKNQVEIN